MYHSLTMQIPDKLWSFLLTQRNSSYSEFGLHNLHLEQFPIEYHSILGLVSFTIQYRKTSQSQITQTKQPRELIETRHKPV